MTESLFGATISILEKSIDLRVQNHSVISSNIANAETPGFRAVRFNFEEELKKVMPRDNALKMARTDPNHIPVKIAPEKVTGTVSKEHVTNQRADSNTVDLDSEVVKMSKNQIMYETMTQLIKGRLEGLLTAIKGV